MDGQGYSLKKIHVEPENMNSEANKQKRRNYADAFMRGIADNQQFNFTDETNYNLFCFVNVAMEGLVRVKGVREE